MVTDVLPAGRSVRFHTGWDKRRETPNYGIHGMTIGFYLRGEEGVVQFKMNTDWIPWEPRPASDHQSFGPRYENRSSPSIQDCFPSAVDLGYHSSRRLHEWQEARPCDLLGGECYYDGSRLNAEPVMVAFIYDGESAVWEELSRYYASTFLTPPAPVAPSDSEPLV